MAKRVAKPKKKMGRPKAHIDWGQVDKLCALHGTQEEVSGFFDISIETLCVRTKEEHGVTFLEYSRQKRGNGKLSLRRKQYELAMRGNGDKTMLIWLGKQWLKQTDKVEDTTIRSGVFKFNKKKKEEDEQ